MKPLICMLGLSGLLALCLFIYVISADPVSKTPITTNAMAEKDVNIIKVAFNDLLSVCPAVTKDFVEKILASRELDLEGVKGLKDSTRRWQNLEYGWTEQVYFAVTSSPSNHRYGGHTHHFYVATGGSNGVVIDGKQESLEFCGIDKNMKDHLFIPVP